MADCSRQTEDETEAGSRKHSTDAPVDGRSQQSYVGCASWEAVTVGSSSKDARREE